MLHTAAQGRHTPYIDGDNWISILQANGSYLGPHPKFTFSGEWVVYAGKVTLSLFTKNGNVFRMYNLIIFHQIREHELVTSVEDFSV